MILLEYKKWQPNSFTMECIMLSATVLSGLLIGLLFWLNLKNTPIIDIVVSIHEIVINLLYFSIVIHIIAAIYHRLKR